MEVKNEINSIDIKCCVPGCSSNKSTNPELCFHNIPSQTQGALGAVRAAWKESLALQTLNSSMVVCSEHFQAHNYDVTTDNQYVLKPHAVPSLNLPNSKNDLDDDDEETNTEENCINPKRRKLDINEPSNSSNNELQQEGTNAEHDMIPRPLTNDGIELTYDICCKNFMKWYRKYYGHIYPNHVVISVYFTELAKVHDIGDLYTIFTNLKKWILKTYNIDIFSLRKLPEQVKSKQLVSQFFDFPTTEKLKQFLDYAPNSKYLLFKVILIFGFVGKLTVEELVNVKISDIENEALITTIHITEIGNELNLPRKKSFQIPPEYFAHYNIYSKLRFSYNKTVNRYFFLKCYNFKMVSKMVDVRLIEQVGNELKNVRLDAFVKQSKRPKEEQLELIGGRIKLPMAEYFKGVEFDLLKNFIDGAENDTHLMTKVMLIFGMIGKLTVEELFEICLGDLADRKSSVVVTIPKTDEEKCFVIYGKFYTVYTDYCDLRLQCPEQKNKRFFLKYFSGKVFRASVDLKYFEHNITKVLQFLNLPVPDFNTFEVPGIERSQINIVTIDDNANDTEDEELILSESCTNEDAKVKLDCTVEEQKITISNNAMVETYPNFHVLVHDENVAIENNAECIAETSVKPIEELEIIPIGESSKPNTENESNNSDMAFWQGLLPMINNLSPNDKLEFKTEVLQLLTQKLTNALCK